MHYKYVYGPVLSRRLRFSLGIDIIPFKNCSCNCIYCQVGRTSNLTLTRNVYTPTSEILKEIKDALGTADTVDYITFSGSGEPTLHTELGVLIQGVQAMTPIPIAVLTNSSLIDRADVQNDLHYASVIAPTLCTVNELTFKKIHRAHHKLSIASIIEGLISFRRTYKGAIWLEVMLIKGINDSDQEIEALKGAIDRIQPDKVHLNTIARPPLESWASPVPVHTLEHIRELIGDRAEIIVDAQKTVVQPTYRNVDRRILAVIRRRPVTIDEISLITGIHSLELTKHMTRLCKQGRVRISRHQDKDFYEIRTKEEA